jgi:excisionase family DNA binding protein
MSTVPSTSLQEPLLTARQVGAMLGGIPSNTVLQYARDGRLPSLRIGKHVRFLRSDVAAELDRMRSPRPQPGASRR